MQLSVLRLFHAVLSDTGARRDPGLADLLSLATRVTHNLMSR